MRLSSTLAPLYLAGFASADLGDPIVDLRTLYDNSYLTESWKGMITPCLEEMFHITDNNIITALIPINDAVKEFRNSPEYASLTHEQLCDLVHYHLVQGAHKMDDLVENGPFLTTYPGTYLQIEKIFDDRRGQGINFYSGLRRKAMIFLGDKEVTKESIPVHWIDKVLTPPKSIADTAMAAGLSAAMGAATQADLDWWTDDQAAYFIPNNNAFAAVASAINEASDEDLKNIMSYHFLNNTQSPIFTSSMDKSNETTAQGNDVLFSYEAGSNDVFVNNAKLLERNILVNNGVLHVIDQVLNPKNIQSKQRSSSPFSLSSFPDAEPANKAPFAGSITQKSKWHVEPGQPDGKILVGHLAELSNGGVS